MCKKQKHSRRITDQMLTNQQFISGMNGKATITRLITYSERKDFPECVKLTAAKEQAK